MSFDRQITSKAERLIKKENLNDNETQVHPTNINRSVPIGMHDCVLILVLENLHAT